MDFKNNEGVVEVFRGMGCIGNKNCFFVTYKDSVKEMSFLPVVGGAIGVLAESMIKNARSIEQQDLSSYEGLLINQNEKGLGVIPLASKHGMQWVANVAKMTPMLDKAVFIPNEIIESIKVKDFNVFNKKVQKINIKIVGVDKPIYQLAHIKEKDIPYQEANFAEFMKKYHENSDTNETTAINSPSQQTLSEVGQVSLGNPLGTAVTNQTIIQQETPKQFVAPQPEVTQKPQATQPLPDQQAQVNPSMMKLETTQPIVQPQAKHTLETTSSNVDGVNRKKKIILIISAIVVAVVAALVVVLLNNFLNKGGNKEVSCITKTSVMGIDMNVDSNVRIGYGKLLDGNMKIKISLKDLGVLYKNREGKLVDQILSIYKDRCEEHCEFDYEYIEGDYVEISMEYDDEGVEEVVYIYGMEDKTAQEIADKVQEVLEDTEDTVCEQR